MKKFLLPLLICFFSVAAFSQEKEETMTCLEKWEKSFSKRGSLSIEDGMHREVYIAVSDKYDCVCLKGKARVEAGKVKAVLLQKQDGTTEVYDGENLGTKKLASISNGVSADLSTTDGRTFNVIFYKKLKPKPSGYISAPDPDDM